MKYSIIELLEIKKIPYRFSAIMDGKSHLIISQGECVFMQGEINREHKIVNFTFSRSEPDNIELVRYLKSKNIPFECGDYIDLDMRRVTIVSIDLIYFNIRENDLNEIKKVKKIKAKLHSSHIRNENLVTLIINNKEWMGDLVPRKERVEFFVATIDEKKQFHDFLEQHGIPIAHASPGGNFIAIDVKYFDFEEENNINERRTEHLKEFLGFNKQIIL